MLYNALSRWTWLVPVVLAGGTPFWVAYALAVNELCRRSVWSLLRLENEHLNNCGQFKAYNQIEDPSKGPQRGRHGEDMEGGGGGSVVSWLKDTLGLRRHVKTIYESETFYPFQEALTEDDTATDTGADDASVYHVAADPAEDGKTEPPIDRSFSMLP